MKKLVVLMLTLISIGAYAKELVVYAPDSMKWMEKTVIESFEKEYQTKVKLIKFDGAAKITSRLLLEKRRPKADVVIGLSQATLANAKKEDLLMKFKPLNSKLIVKKEYEIDSEYYATTFDFGGLAIIYDPEKLNTVPTSFEDIKKIEKGLIMQDPRTSTTGQDFLLWTIAVYGDKWQEFWKELKPAILTVTPGWGEAFGKFETGEAPMMVSYATDGAYSYHYYGGTKYKALIPEEGGFVQVEGAAVVNKKNVDPMALTFIEFILSDSFQKEIPLNQWMFPVTNVELPEVFKHAEKIDTPLTLSSEEVEKNLTTWLNEWEKIMRK